MKAVILAGGLGTRLKNLSDDIPKPLMKVAGIPVLERQILALKSEGVFDFVLITCHLSEAIENYFGNGERLGVSISYFKEEEPLGTAGALFRLDLQEDFLLLNGDLIFNFSVAEMLKTHREKKALVTCFAHHSTHPQDSTLIDCDKNGKIRRFILKGESNPDECSLTNAGIFIINPGLLSMFSFEGKADFDRDVLQKLEGREVFAYESFEYVKDMGTEERLTQVEANIESGVVSALSKNREQKAIFLDRDGTINKYVGYVRSPEQLELIEGVEVALKRFHQLGYLCILITNQPTVARGENTIEEIEKINNHLQYLLCEKGTYLDGIYFCPHHPESGFEGENPQYKIDCDCRKPKPGMIFQAKKDFNIDLSLSYMAGDDERDILCGKNAGVKSILISENHSLKDFSDKI